MKIRVADIPEEGLQIAFTLNGDALDKRAEGVRDVSSEEGILPPKYSFVGDIQADLLVSLERTSVLLSGRVASQLRSTCGRCAEEALQPLNVKVEMLLEPRQGSEPGQREECEDVSFGFYEGEEVDCEEVLEELLMLSLPFSVLCKESCEGLCPECGQNLNQGICACSEQPAAGSIGQLILDKIVPKQTTH